MIDIIKCMCIDSYFCLLVLGQVISWIGIGVTVVYTIKKLFSKKEPYEL